MTTSATIPAGERPVGVDIQERAEPRRHRGPRGRQRELLRDPHAWPGPGHLPGRLVLRRETVEERLGREWETHEFQLAIISPTSATSGNGDDDEIVIAWDH